MRKLIAFVITCALAVTSFAAPAAKAKKQPVAKKAEVVIIESPEYVAGQEDPQLTAGLSQFLGAEVVVTKTTPQEAAENDKLAGISYDFLPLYLVGKTAEIRAKFEQPLANGYLTETNDYIVLPHQTRSGVYVGKEAKPGVMELFVMSQCPYGVMAENLVIQAKKDGKMPADKDIKIRYIVGYNAQRGFNSLHGSGEWEEDVRQLLIAKYYPEKLWKYLEIRNKDYRSSRWDKAMEDAGINAKKIMKKFDTEGLELLKAEAAYGQEYGVNASPTFLWEGKVQMDFNAASKIEGFEFLNPNAARKKGQAAVPAGSC